MIQMTEVNETIIQYQIKYPNTVNAGKARTQQIKSNKITLQQYYINKRNIISDIIKFSKKKVIKLSVTWIQLNTKSSTLTNPNINNLI